MYRIDNSCWFYISIHYGREYWPRLIEKAHLFYRQNLEEFTYWLLFLSEERGENVRLVFCSPIDLAANAQMQEKIDQTFREFLEKFPSPSAKQFPYGEFIWKYYDNNILNWNRFEICDYGGEGRFVDFAQKTSFLLTDLLKNDTSIDNAFSVALYLCVQLTQFLENENIRSFFDNVIDNIISDFDSYDSYRIATSTLEQNEMDLANILPIIGEYYEEIQSLDEKAHYYNEWIKEASLLFSSHGSIRAYQYLCTLICEHLGLGYSHQFTIFNFIQRWFESKK